MKHLKTYNESAFSKEDYYSRIRPLECPKFEERTPFTDVEIEKLKQLFIKREFHLTNIRTNNNKPDLSGLYAYAKSTNVYMDKYNDEWYILTYKFVTDVYYKCDGFKGLLKCLEDILPKYMNTNESAFSKEDYYDEIELPKLWSFRNEQKITKLTKSELDIIADVVKSKGYTYNKHYPLLFINTENQKLPAKFVKSCEFDVIKFEDDWYILRLFPNNEHFKCDGFKGLLKCLEDKL